MQNSIKQGVISPEKNPLSWDESQERSKFIHLFIRGNYRQDVFFDKVDFINAWNRLWLSAYATGAEIWAAEFLSNHMHFCARIGGLKLPNFVHHFRMSLSAYFNRRYNVHGSLGSRRYGAGQVIDIEEDGGDDARDLIRYILRNVTHHGMTDKYGNWPYSTYRYIFELSEEHSIKCSDMSIKVLKAFTPSSAIIPKEWRMSKEGLIIPPDEVFPREDIENLFYSKTDYIKACNIPSRREDSNEGEKNERLVGYKSSLPLTDQTIIDLIGQLSTTPIVSMTKKEIKEVVKSVSKEFPKASSRQLSRILHVPASTITYWLSKVGQ